MESAGCCEGYIIGIAATPVGIYSDNTFTDLGREMYKAAIKDAQLTELERIEGTWLARILMNYWGIRAMQGLGTLVPLVDEGVLPNGQAVIDVEAVVLHGADLTFASGVEKMNPATKPAAELLQRVDGGLPESHLEPYRNLASELGISFEPEVGCSLWMNIYALLALSHIRQYGTTVDQIAAAVARNHSASVDNPRAQYAFAMSAAVVLSDRVVADPLRRSMCAPHGDGAAAVLVCSERFFKTQAAYVREPTLRVRGYSLAGGRINAGWEDQRSPVSSAAKTYEISGVTPQDLDLIELHDASSFAEIHLVEDHGLCPRGSRGPFTASGMSQRKGQMPVNLSGGLVTQVDPVATTGHLMLNELAVPLRGEADPMQIPYVALALATNGGGLAASISLSALTTTLEGAA